MNKYQRLATNTFLMSIGTFGSKLLVFLMVRFYTGYLTPAEYGTADLITQTANLLIPMVSLDITDGVFRFAADRQNGRTSVFTVGLRIIMLGSAGMLLVIFLRRRIPAVQAYGMLLASFVMASCSWVVRTFCASQREYGAVCGAGTAQYGIVPCMECAVFGNISLGCSGLCAFYHSGKPGDHGIPGLEGTAVAICGAESGIRSTAADAPILYPSDSGGGILVDHGRIGPVYGAVFYGQRCQ